MRDSKSEVPNLVLKPKNKEELDRILEDSSVKALDLSEFGVRQFVNNEFAEKLVEKLPNLESLSIQSSFGLDYRGFISLGGLKELRHLDASCSNIHLRRPESGKYKFPESLLSKDDTSFIGTKEISEQFIPAKLNYRISKLEEENSSLKEKLGIYENSGNYRQQLNNKEGSQLKGFKARLELWKNREAAEIESKKR